MKVQIYAEDTHINGNSVRMLDEEAMPVDTRESMLYYATKLTPERCVSCQEV
jgi:hypothetical protein